MNEFRAKMGEDGRIVIPAACRRLLHVKPGEELIMHVDKDELHVFSLKHSLKKAQEKVQKYSKGKSLVKQLKTMRKEEADE
jgi:AbrB family looped-hinge helix DNA binding protein